MNKKQIEITAEKLIEELEIKEWPVPVDKIAQQKGLEVRPFDDLGENVSGVLVVHDGAGTIGFNSGQSKVRQRFTIAHEIGHYILHCENAANDVFIDTHLHYNKIEFRNHISSTGTNRKEQQANAFAAALLMPTKFLVEEIRNHHLDLSDDESLVQLARSFNVSTLAMSYRIANLDPHNNKAFLTFQES